MERELWTIIGRSIITIITLFLVIKILGKKQMSQLTLYDYIIGITIGSIAADTIISLDENVLNGLLAIFTFGILGAILSYLAIKSTKADTILNGKPVNLMENGNIIFENLKETKISVAKLIEEARLKGYYDINLINWAVLETNGQISFLPKEEYQNTNTKDFKTDLKTKVSKQTMCMPLIIDGEINYDTLDFYNKDIDWLDKEIKKKKVLREDIILATIDEKQKVTIFEK